MVRGFSRRPGPDHPLLFVDADDIPVPVLPPQPRAAAALAPFSAVLAAAQTTTLAELDQHSVGREVLVGGERRRGDAGLTVDVVLDDGTAVMPVTVSTRASRVLRDALQARFVLVTATLRNTDGMLHLDVAHAVDLRALAREWASRR
jgi:hypothetical protein